MNETKVLGIDVGIKNLGYCLLEDKGDESICVLDNDFENWGVINALDDENIKCCYDDCEEIPNKYSYINGELKYFCKSHKKYHKAIILTHPIEQKELENSNVKCSHTASCKTKSKWLINGKELCNKHKDIFVSKLEKERELCDYKIKIKDFTLNEKKIKILEKLEKNKERLLKAEVVCIENQPHHMVGEMKAIAETIYTWFLIRGIIDCDSNNSCVKKVTYQGAVSKLEQKIRENLDGLEGKTKYKKTKLLAVDQCNYLLRDKPEYLEHIKTFKKKDDMSDACLHAYRYIMIKKYGKK